MELELILEQLNKHPESEWIEYKENNADPNKIGEYISALSNSACINKKDKAYLIFGINNDLKIVGTNFKPKSKKIGNEELENWLSVSLNPKVDFKIIEFTNNNRNIVAFVIDKAKERPVSFKNQEFIRIGSYKKNLKDHPEKERKIWEFTSNIKFEDKFAIKNISYEDILSYLDYSKYFEFLNISLPENKFNIIDKLIEEEIIIKKDNEYNISNLGAILFAKNLNNFDNLRKKIVRVIIYNNFDKVEGKKEKEFIEGYAISYKNIVDYVIEQLPTNEVIEKALRIKKDMYPEIAIRELVANTIIHQDFEVEGTNITIEIFKDRIEFTNPGESLVEESRLIDGVPKSRNEKMVKFMKRINICEERGSGIDKIIKSVEEYQLPAPFFYLDYYVKVTLYSHISFDKMNKDDRIRACYQHCCLKHVSNDLMTNQSLRNRFELKDSKQTIVSKIIKDTINQKLIIMVKKSPVPSYKPYWA